MHHVDFFDTFLHMCAPLSTCSSNRWFWIVALDTNAKSKPVLDTDMSHVRFFYAYQKISYKWAHSFLPLQYPNIHAWQNTMRSNLKRNQMGTRFGQRGCLKLGRQEGMTRQRFCTVLQYFALFCSILHFHTKFCPFLAHLQFCTRLQVTVVCFLAPSFFTLHTR